MEPKQFNYLVNEGSVSYHSGNIYDDNTVYYNNGAPVKILSDGQSTYSFLVPYQGNNSGQCFSTQGNFNIQDSDPSYNYYYIFPSFDEYLSDQVNVEIAWRQTNISPQPTGVVTLDLKGNIEEQLLDQSLGLSLVHGSLESQMIFRSDQPSNFILTMRPKSGSFGDSESRISIVRHDEEEVWTNTHLNKIIPMDKRALSPASNTVFSTGEHPQIGRRDHLGRGSDDYFVNDACQDENNLYCVANKVKYSRAKTREYVTSLGVNTLGHKYIPISGDIDRNRVCNEKFLSREYEPIQYPDADTVLVVPNR